MSRDAVTSARLQTLPLPLLHINIAAILNYLADVSKHPNPAIPFISASAMFCACMLLLSCAMCSCAHIRISTVKFINTSRRYMLFLCYRI